MTDGQLERKKRPAQVRGLNWNYNHELKNVFKGAANCGQHWPGSISRVLPWTAEERNAAGDGAFDLGAQDRRHCLEDLEERRILRRRTSEVKSSLSAQSLSECEIIVCANSPALSARVRG